MQTLEISGLTLCSADAGRRLFAGIKHKTLEKLGLGEINLTTAAAESLGQSLSELSALQILLIRGVTLSSADAGRRLFAGIKHKTLETLGLSEINLTTAAAEALGQSLSELSALQTLEISGVTLFSADAGRRLFAGIKHKTLKDLELSKINLTSAAAVALGQSLPELSALQTLEIEGFTECSDEAVTKLVTAIKHKTLKKLKLCEMKLTSTVAESLGQSLPELSALRTLKVSGLIKCSDDAVTRLITAIKNETLEKLELELSEMNLTSAAAVALVKPLFELPSLQILKISGSDGCSLHLDFSVLRELEISGVSKLSAEEVTRLIDVIKQKPLEKLERSEVQCTTSAIAKALGMLLPKLSALQTLKISSLAECPDDAVTKLVTAIKQKTLLELKLSEMNLTSVAAVALGQSLPELPSLQKLEISGSDGCSLQLEFPVLLKLKINGKHEFFAEAVTRLIDVIKHKPLEKQKLSGIHLTSAVAEVLCQLLPELSALQKLKMTGLTECSDDALTKLVTAIKHKTLEKLELCEIDLTSTIADSLAQSLPELSALRTLKVSGFIKCSDEVATRLGAVIKHKTLEKLDLSEIHLTSAVAESLGQSLPELSALRTLKVSGLIKCSDDAVTRLVSAIKHKTLEKLDLSEIHLTSAVAESLDQSLPGLSALRTLKVSGSIECSDDAVTRLVASIKHKTLEELVLSKIIPTSAAAVMLSQSLPELQFLQKLKISGSDGCSLQLGFPVLRELQIGGLIEFSVEAVTRLIDFIKTKPFEKLELSEINLTSAAAEALVQLLPELSALQTLKINGLTERSDGAGSRFFAAFKLKTLKKLKLNEINVTSAATEALAQSLPELSALQTLRISGLTECSEKAVTKLVAAIKHKTLEKLELSEINLTSVAAKALGQSLPELSALKTLMISGLDGCRLRHKKVEALFGRFNRPSSLKELWFTDFTARGSLAPLVKNLCLFPCLKVLKLEYLAMGEGDLSGLLENLKFTPDLRSLHLRGNPVGHAVRSMIPYLLGQQKLVSVVFWPGDCSEEDLKYVQEAVKEKRPQLKIETSW